MLTDEQVDAALPELNGWERADGALRRSVEFPAFLDGIDAVDTPSSERRRLRRTVQLVFQNPYGSLNPRQKIGTVRMEPLVINTDVPADAP